MHPNIEYMIEQVLSEPEYDPCRASVFLRAVDNHVLHGIVSQLSDALLNEQPNHAALGSVIYNAVYDYCYRVAEKEALRRYNESLGQ